MVLQDYIQRQTKAASLAVFRVLFGFVMAISIIRFWYNGWIEKLYLLPDFHFHYNGFEFIDVPGNFTYVIFIICFLSSLFVAIGLKYRIAIVLFFLSFTYIELLDKTTYLNHYYFVSVVSFLLILLPMHVNYSWDAYKNASLRSEYIPQWTVDVLKLMLALVYIYAGLAKLNSDWLLRAMPLAIWLPTKMDVPLLGALMHEKWMHYLFSWGGAIYDLSIVFLLYWNRTRLFAFGLVIIFHILTRVLFPIGMFPYIMIALTMIFFSGAFHEKLMQYFLSITPASDDCFQNGRSYTHSQMSSVSVLVISVFMMFQILFPLRSLFLSDNVYWTERGYRFSWRVMLMEKTGYANFKIVNGKSQKQFYVRNEDFLTSLQQKQMATQPDMILEYGQYLGQHFASQGHENVEVYVESYAALNGRISQAYIADDVNLMNIDYGELCNNHITALND